MGTRRKLWTSMQLVTLASITALSGCSSDIETEENNVESVITQAPLEASHIPEGEGEGEGEEGEGEGAAGGIDLATDDLAYLTQLGLMRGHLFVGSELYKTGYVEHAKTHMKHPKNELYADVEPAFSVRGSKGFSAELEALASAVEADQGQDSVNAAYTALGVAIAASESRVSTASVSPAEKLKLVVALLRVAAEEYAIAVIDGKMENAHEYQDALGFTHIAKHVIGSVKSDDTMVSAAIEKAAGIVTNLEPLWPTLIPPETLETEAGQLYGAASKIEILALGLE